MVGAWDPLAWLEFRHIESYWLFYLTVSWILGFGGYWLVRLRRPELDWPWHRVLGIVLVLWPFVKFGHEFVESISFVLDPASVAGTVPEWAWWRAVRRRSVQYVLVPLVGMYLAFGHHLPGAFRSFGERVRATLAGIDLWPRVSLNRDFALGLGIFVPFFFAYLLLGLALSPLRQLDTGDESAVFNALTPALAVVLAVVAGVTEELLFRGILQTRLARIMPLWGAIGIQAVAFGLIHSGYGTVGHIVLPIFFGIAAGILAYYLGVIPVILIHFALDLVIFLAIAANNGYAWTAWFVPAVFLVSITWFFAYYVPRWIRQARGGGPQGDAGTDEPQWDPVRTD